MKIGVWSGNINIENVSVNPDAAKLLNIPFEIVFSHIERLEMKVPWKSIQNQPCELLIQGFNIVLSSQHQQQWPLEFDREEKVKAVEKYAQNYIEELVAKYKENSVDKESKQSYAQKITMKIVDNLQIKIADIHVKFEAHHDPKLHYAFGIDLDYL